MTTIRDFEFELSELWRIDYAITDGNGVPVPIEPASGDTLELRIVAAGALVLKLGIGSGITVTNGPGGLATAVISEALQITSGFVPREYEHECFYGSALRGNFVVNKGRFNVNRSLRKSNP